MDRKERIEYLIITLCVLITGFIIYGNVGSMGAFNLNKTQSFLYFGCMGGFGFSAILSAIIFAFRFLSTKTLIFKIVAALLWPITFACVVFIGFLGFIPYQIYNIIKIITDKDLEN